MWGASLHSWRRSRATTQLTSPTLFWAAIPGNAGDFPAEESFYTFIEQALCLFVEKTSGKDSLSPFGMRMVDRLTGKPIHLDISDLPMKTGVIPNHNKLSLGPFRFRASHFLPITW